VPGLDLEDDLLGLGARLVVEVDAPVNAAVGALLLVRRAGADQAEGPELELVGVLGGEGARPRPVHRLADGLVGGGDLGAELVAQALLDQGDGQVGDVNADPAAAQLLRRGDGGAAAAEGVQHHVALLARTMRSSRATGFCVG